jgi:hypothetical protein
MIFALTVAIEFTLTPEITGPLVPPLTGVSRNEYAFWEMLFATTNTPRFGEYWKRP